MPNIKSAEKRMRTNEIRHQRNIDIKSELKTYCKKCDLVLAEKKKEEAAALIKETIRKLSKAVTKNVLHRNTASRKISQLMRKLNKV